MKRNKTKIIINVLLLLLFSSIVFSLSFTSSPQMNNFTQSNEEVLCSWNSSIDTTQTNLTWYNNSNLFSSITDATPPTTLAASNTKKDEVWTCKITIGNGTTTFSENTTLTIKNSDPTNLLMYNQSNNINLGSSITIYENSNHIFYLNASDYDNDNILYGWSLFYKIPNGSNLDHGSGVFTWLPDNESSEGVHNVTFTVEDDDGGIDSLQFIMTVIAVNDAPEFNPSLIYQNATEDSTFEYNISAIDEELDYPLTFSIVDDDGINGSDALGLKIENISSTQGRLYFTPIHQDKGNRTITINVSDTAGKWTNQTFILEISPINQIPSFYFENISANQSELFTMNLNATDLDVNDTLNFTIEAIGCPYSNLWNVTTLNNSASNSIGLINVTLTNEHIICREIKIGVTDSKQENYSIITLNITNKNDAPIIYQNSSYSYNGQNNINIYNLSTYSNAEFKYRLNFSDPDTLTYEDENLSVNIIGFTNFSYNLNSTTGELNFTTNQNGTFYMNINLSDDEGLWINETLIINIYSNSIPIVESINITINESEIWTYIINATDPENDSMNYSLIFLQGENIFSVNPTTGEINFTPSQETVGNYTISLIATDSRGSPGEGVMNLEILNKNDPPILNNISFPIIVVNLTFTINITANDKDLSLNNSYENLTYWIQWINSTTNLSNLFNITEINESLIQIFNFTPTQIMVGTYNITIGVNDSYGLTDEYNFTFTIHNASLAPIIINITPYGPPPTKFGWTNVSNFPNKYTTINVTENITILFNHSTINEIDENLTYSWYYEDSLISNNYSYNHFFDYSSSSINDTIKNITLIVRDNKYKETYFSWIINITDMNRPVVRGTDNNNPTSINITLGVKYDFVKDYLKIDKITGVFYDPDDDTNNNGELDGNETNNLEFSANYCSGVSDVLDIDFSNGGMTITPLRAYTGTASYNYTATDGYASVTSDCVEYYIDYNPETDPEIITKYITKKEPRPTYYQVEVDKIINLDILSPKAITLYENNTAKIPITVKNDGKDTIKKINLYAFSENDEITMRFEDNYIEQLLVLEEFETYLYIESYRSQGSYEIEIIANATDPKFSDKAIVLVNSLQKERDEKAKNATLSKITFAMDLLNSNVECLDLNEILETIKKDIDNLKFEKANEKIEEVMSACRYLISEQEINEESPNMISLSMDKIKNNQSLAYMLLGLLLSSILGIGFSIYYTNKSED